MSFWNNAGYGDDYEKRLSRKLWTLLWCLSGDHSHVRVDVDTKLTQYDICKTPFFLSKIVWSISFCKYFNIKGRWFSAQCEFCTHVGLWCASSCKFLVKFVRCDRAKRKSSKELTICVTSCVKYSVEVERCLCT